MYILILILILALEFVVGKSQIAEDLISTDSTDSLYNIEPEDNLSISLPSEGDFIAETDSPADCSSDDLLDQILDTHAQKRSLSPSQHVKRQVCRPSNKPPSKSSGSAVGTPHNPSTDLEQKPVPKAQESETNPCQGSARNIHVTCGGPEIVRLPTNVVLNCVSGKFLHRDSEQLCDLESTFRPREVD